jgi:hypothetical protein
LHYLQQEAKDLRKAHAARDASCCETLRLVRRFARKGDTEILGSDLKLTEAQHALAMDYGFKSWAELNRHVADTASRALKYVGASVTFRAQTKAPDKFDAWTFWWRGPRVEDFEADLDYLVLRNGKEHFVYEDLTGNGGGLNRSDFDEHSPCEPRLFWGQEIAITFRVSKGRVKFSRGYKYHFAFYRKDERGEVNWHKPFQAIDAVAE